MSIKNQSCPLYTKCFWWANNKAQGPNSANLAIEWLPKKMKSCSPYRHIAYGVKGINAMAPTSDWHLTSDILIDVRSSSSVMQQWHSDNSLKTEESWKSENHLITRHQGRSGPAARFIIFLNMVDLIQSKTDLIDFDRISIWKSFVAISSLYWEW